MSEELICVEGCEQQLQERMLTLCTRVPVSLYEIMRSEASREGITVSQLIRRILADRYGVKVVDDARHNHIRDNEEFSKKVSEAVRLRAAARYKTLSQVVIEEVEKRPWIKAVAKSLMERLDVSRELIRHIYRSEFILGVHVVVYEALKRDIAKWLCEWSKSWHSNEMYIALHHVYDFIGVENTGHLNRVLAAVFLDLGARLFRSARGLRFIFTKGQTCRYDGCYGDLRVVRMLYEAYTNGSEDVLKALWEAANRCVQKA